MDFASPSADWHQRLSDLSLACAGAAGTEAGCLLRATRRLLSEAPAPWDSLFAGLPRREDCDALIAAGAEAAAALALVEGRGSYMISYGPGGQHLATVVFEGRSGEASAQGANLALAVLGALAASLAATGLGRAALRAKQVDQSALRLN